MSEICSAFGCTPSEAVRQDWALVQAVLDYRNARTAIEMVNQGAKGAEELQRHPDLGQLLVDMHRAQDDSEVTVDGILAEMATRTEEE